MINRRTLLAALGLMPAAPAIAAIPLSQPVPPAPTGLDVISPDTSIGVVKWTANDGTNDYKITVTDKSSGDVRTWRCYSPAGVVNTLTFSAVKNRVYKVKVEAVHRDGSRRTVKRYDVDFIRS